MNRLLANPASLSARTLVVAIAALAALAIAVASVSEAGASSGGVGPGGTEEEAGTSGGKYIRLWDRTARRDRRWAHRTAKCESGKNPDAIGGGGQYRGAFQFMKSTWKRAPKSPGGDPIEYNYRTQAVVAIELKKRDGAGHWPNCG